MVIILLGILAANAMPRFFAASRFEAMGFADAVSGALRYAQKVALTTRCDTRVQIDSTGYQVFQRATSCTAGALTRPVAQAGGGDWRGTAPGGVAVGALDLYFDARGRPRDVTSDALHTTTQNVVVGGQTITVEPTTGYTHAG